MRRAIFFLLLALLLAGCSAGADHSRTTYNDHSTTVETETRLENDQDAKTNCVGLFNMLSCNVLQTSKQSGEVGTTATLTQDLWGLNCLGGITAVVVLWCFFVIAMFVAVRMPADRG